jgi:hypothetical protein
MRKLTPAYLEPPTTTNARPVELSGSSTALRNRRNSPRDPPPPAGLEQSPHCRRPTSYKSTTSLGPRQPELASPLTVVVLPAEDGRRRRPPAGPALNNAGKVLTKRESGPATRRHLSSPDLSWSPGCRRSSNSTARSMGRIRLMPSAPSSTTPSRSATRWRPRPSRYSTVHRMRLPSPMSCRTCGAATRSRCGGGQTSGCTRGSPPGRSGSGASTRAASRPISGSTPSTTRRRRTRPSGRRPRRPGVTGRVVQRDDL